MLEQQQVEYGQPATAPPDPERLGYTFTGWDVNFDNVTSHLNVTAQYEAVEYTVIFQDYDGTVLSIVKVSAGAGLTAPVTPTRSGYTFLGWSVGLQAITADTVAVALYDPACLVRFYNWNDSLLASMFVDIGGAATAPTAPTRTGYTFTGWSSQYSAITEDTDITAMFQINVYTVIFKNYNGTILSTQQVEYGGAAVAPATPTRAEHVFTGWSGAFDNITSDKTVTAQFSVNQYTVVFLDHNGDVLSTQQVIYSGTATAPEDPTREGYTFKGWDKEFSSVTENITVRAEYEKNAFEIPDFDFKDAGIAGGLIFAAAVLIVAFILLKR